MKLFLTCLALCLSHFFYAQNYKYVDHKIQNYPHSFDSPEKLAVLINKDFSTQSDKARAIYAWISTNVKYDLDMAKANSSGKAYSYKTEQERVIKEKKFRSYLCLKGVNDNKAICHGYSILFETLCGLTGLESLTVVGTLKTEYEEIGKLPVDINHAWNVVKIDSQWKFIDTTLGAGSLSGPNGEFVADYNDGFFFTSPEMFFLNHYPQEEKWLLIKKNKQDFAALPLYYRDYLKAPYKINTPQKGNLHSTSNELSFKFENVTPYFIPAYFTDGTNKLQVLYQNEDTSDYIAEINNKIDNYITLVVDKKMIATYKLK